jgi:hypothetical protein
MGSFEDVLFNHIDLFEYLMALAPPLTRSVLPSSHNYSFHVPTQPYDLHNVSC